MNYELVWVDDSEDSVSWVQEEFDALWYSHEAIDLADAVIEDIGRLAVRSTYSTVDDWRSTANPNPAAPIIELPVYRKESGLWAHQKAFIHRAYEEHQKGGARFVLADQVGLGKTVQLGLAAKLMALVGDKPILILTPKTLMEQWQGELWNLLAFPSARWNGRQWIDEHGIAYPDNGLDGLKRCPRRAGIVSTGLIRRPGDAALLLESQEYECVILDEAHHARRQNLGATHRGEPANPTNLLRFIRTIGRKTKSLLLATATPVQLDPIEAWDLLSALAEGNDKVLGGLYSLWRRNPWGALDLAMGRSKLEGADVRALVWDWLRDPFPPAREGPDFAVLRRGLGLADNTQTAVGSRFMDLRPPDFRRLDGLRSSLFTDHNPFIRHIVRRTRAFLEETIDPTTNEPYLQPVHVRLHGEGDTESIILPAYLERAYESAEKFCQEVGKRPGMSAGFLRTLLLRRVGSTIEAGKITALKMLGNSAKADDDEDDSADEDAEASALYPLTEAEKVFLRQFADALESNQDVDPKFAEIERKLMDGWLDRGCIIFSQYYDSVQWIAAKLSEKLPDEPIGVYASASRTCMYRDGHATPITRDEIKRQVQAGTLRLLLGTDAASEGLNLQRLGTLINADLPWNPTRLEQRKGRIQRIGQVHDTVDIYNMRYRGSVEDRVHQLLSTRLENIAAMFGQVPDTLEDVWVDVALAEDERAKQVIDAVVAAHPFEMRYDRIENVPWEQCSKVLEADQQLETLRRGWGAS
jgi:superfamily II DNA or RNA helicase